MSRRIDQTPRERLLGCAVELVNAEGVGALGVRELARRAGVSHNAPSRHFPTHSALYNAVAGVGFARFCTELERAMDGLSDPFDRLQAQAGAYLQFASSNRGMFELMWRHDLVDPSAPELSEIALQAFELFRDAVVGCQMLGWQHETGADTLAGALWSWVHGLAHLWLYGAMPIFAMPVDLDAHLRAGFALLGIPIKEHQS